MPYGRPVHDRLRLEVARGCTRGCRFCQAGFIYRPLRERDPQVLLEVIDESLRNTGYDELSLLALSVGDCTYLPPLVRYLMARYGQEKVALSLPSLRVGTLAEDLIEDIKKVRKTGFTLAPEAATERLQRVINKIVPEEEVLSTAKKAFGAGWRLPRSCLVDLTRGERWHDTTRPNRLRPEASTGPSSVDVWSCGVSYCS